MPAARRGCSRAPREVLAGDCIGHRGPGFCDERRRRSGGARWLVSCLAAGRGRGGVCLRGGVGSGFVVEEGERRASSVTGGGCSGWGSPGPARLVLSGRGAAGECRPRGPQRGPPPGVRRSARRRVCGRERCRRTRHVAVGLRRCVVPPWCWPCSPSGARRDRSRGALALTGDHGRGRWRPGACPEFRRGGGWQALRSGWLLAVARARGRICGRTLARVLNSRAAVRGPGRLPAGCADNGWRFSP